MEGNLNNLHLQWIHCDQWRLVLRRCGSADPPKPKAKQGKNNLILEINLKSFQ